jgi:hypothetical protein
VTYDPCPGLGGTGPRCDEGICDCFIDEYPDSPDALHPEAYVVLGNVPPEEEQ